MPPDGAASAQRALESLVLLVVDDDDDVRDLTVFMLRRAGATVIEAGGARAAVGALLGRPVDALVSDIAMPLEDGCDLIRRIRRMPEGRCLSAVAFSAYNTAGDRQRCIDAGFDLHLAKPASAAELETAVVEVLRRRA